MPDINNLMKEFNFTLESIIERSKYLADKLMYLLTNANDSELVIDMYYDDWEKIKQAYIDLFGENEWFD